MNYIFRKYEFPDAIIAEDLLSQLEDNIKIAEIKLGVTENGLYSVDVIWKDCEVCPEILWEYIYIGESSHYFEGYDDDDYKPYELTIIQ